MKLLRLVSTAYVALFTFVLSISLRVMRLSESWLGLNLRLSDRAKIQRTGFVRQTPSTETTLPHSTSRGRLSRAKTLV
jgi:hypothetical protein